MARYSYHFRSSVASWNELSPHTYILTSDNYPTTRNGMTFGKSGTITSSLAYTAVNHSRLSGSVAATNAGAFWRVDLLDGPGTYRMYLAVGRLGGSATTGLKVLAASNNALITEIVNASIAAGQVKDATGVAMSAPAWLQSNVSATGTAQAGTTSDITLAAGSSAVNDFYVGKTVLLTSGTGSGQYKEIVDYDGATKVATVRGTWTTPPNATTGYSICDGGGAYFEFTTTETALKFQAQMSRMDIACIELEYIVTPLVDVVLSEEHGSGVLSKLYAKEPQGKKIGKLSSAVGTQNFSVVGTAATWLTVAAIDGAPWLVATGTPMPDNFPTLCSSITIRQTTANETRDTVIPLPTFVPAPTKPMTGRLSLLTTRTWLERERIRAVTRGQSWPGYQGQTIAPARDFVAASPAQFKSVYQAITPDGTNWYRIRLQGSTAWTGIQDVSGAKDFGSGGLLVEPDTGHDPIVGAQWDDLLGRNIHWRGSILVPLGNYCFNGTSSAPASSYARILIEGNRIGHLFVPGETISNYATWSTFMLYRFYEEFTIRNNQVAGLNFLALASGGRMFNMIDNDVLVWTIADTLRVGRGYPLSLPRGVFADDESWYETSGNRYIRNPDTFANKAAANINHGDKVQIARPGNGYLYPYSKWPNGNPTTGWQIPSSPPPKNHQTWCLNIAEKTIYSCVALAANPVTGEVAGEASGSLNSNRGQEGRAAAGDIVDGGVTWRYHSEYLHEGNINLLMEDEFGNDGGLTYSNDTALVDVIAPSHQLLISSNVGMLCPTNVVAINCIYANGGGRGIDAGHDGIAHVELCSFVGPDERPVSQGIAITLNSPYIDGGTIRAFNNIIGHSTQVAIPGGANLQNGLRGGIAHQGNLVVDFTNTTANGRRPTELLTGPFSQRSDGSYGFTLAEEGTQPIDAVISDLAKIMHPLSGNAGGRATEYHVLTIQDSLGATVDRTLTITP